MKSTYLSVVIPCFDEMANLQKGVLEKVHSFLEKKEYSYEVIIVDDGSKDESVAFIEKFISKVANFKLIKSEHVGKAGAVTAGMLAAKGEYVLFTDMDQATPIEELDRVMPYFKDGYDVVIGSRNKTRKGSPFIRLAMSRGWMILRGLIINMHGISDTQCGFKIFRGVVAQKIFQKISDIHHGFKKVSGSSVGAGFDVELLFLALQLGYKIKEVPVQWLHVETRRVNHIQDSLEGISYLLRIRANEHQGLYKNT